MKVKTKANVLISTLQLGMNYGGLLQAYSLMTFLNQNDCDAKIFWKHPRKMTFKRLLRQFLEHVPFHNLFDIKTDLKKRRNLFEFINHELKLVENSSVRNALLEGNFNFLVIGSDQVWREAYNADARDDFFPIPILGVNYISYAASFGSLLSSQSDSYKRYFIDNIRSFNAVSLREKNATSELINDYGLDVSFVCDPVLLLDGEHFSKKFGLNNNAVKNIDLLIYTLDTQISKIDFSQFERTYPIKTIKIISHSEHSVTDFLDLFSRSKAVITDSYHGMIFSVLFGSRAGVIVNSRRGAERFISFAEAIDGQAMLADDTLSAAETVFNSEPLFDPEKLATFQSCSREYLLTTVKHSAKVG